MCVDVSKGSLHSLVTLILQHESVLLQSESVPIDRTRATPDARGRQGGLEGEDNSEIQRSLVLSAVNILTTQMFQLLRGATSAQVSILFLMLCPQRVGLLGVLMLLHGIQVCVTRCSRASWFNSVQGNRTVIGEVAHRLV